MYSISFRTSLGVAAAVLALAGCDNPVSPEHHEEPHGIVILADTIELARVTGGVTVGQIEVAQGAQTPGLTVVFLDDHDEEITLEEEYSLDVTSTTPAVATWQGTPAGGFNGRVNGHVAGSTLLEFQLVHGPIAGGHAEGGVFVVPVTVTATQP